MKWSPELPPHLRRGCGTCCSVCWRSARRAARAGWSGSWPGGSGPASCRCSGTWSRGSGTSWEEPRGRRACRQTQAGTLVTAQTVTTTTMTQIRAEKRSKLPLVGAWRLHSPLQTTQGRFCSPSYMTNNPSLQRNYLQWISCELVFTRLLQSKRKCSVNKAAGLRVLSCLHTGLCFPTWRRCGAPRRPSTASWQRGDLEAWSRLCFQTARTGKRNKTTGGQSHWMAWTLTWSLRFVSLLYVHSFKSLLRLVSHSIINSWCLIDVKVRFVNRV